MEQEILMKIANEINRQIRCGVTADVSLGAYQNVLPRFIRTEPPLPCV